MSFRGCFFVAAFLWPVLAGAAADETSPFKTPQTAVSPNGQYRLTLTHSEQGPSPWDKEVSSISGTFRLESRANQAADFLSQLPENVFLEKVDLEEAVLLSGENVANQKGSKWTDTSDLTVTIHTHEVGKSLQQLRRLKLVVTLAKITEWKYLEFKGIQKAGDAPLKCGPFELVVSEVQPQHLVLSAAAFSEHALEHEIYRQQMPLLFLTHRYALENLKITDAADQRLSLSSGTFSGGGGSGRYAVLRGTALSFTASGKAGDQSPASLFEAVEDIHYPVTLGLKLPLKYESERVTFEFQDLPFPNSKPLK
ncbi:hypothetical protein [Prosthecobacter dejongeii]|uniref:Uncharacterized protein n=1 Tax=Prosthecobacter dejongeii TaxID=48465 RepID=A0A7W8DS23_9BACT|nr:hypothetical protein [Prosthecobacter dejongeii]MBB5039426.1 hypothetical protein [Prosthecobacter dejongeii]